MELDKMAEIPESHPRRKSLISRQIIVDATKQGLLADSAMIAHGRGEAFDYILGEKTSEKAKLSILSIPAFVLSFRLICVSLILFGRLLLSTANP